jgi:Zn-dependent protease with chaperone function
MEEKEFVALVERLEVYSQKNPAAYRFRVGLLAFVGYLFLFSAVMIVALIVGAVIYAGTINFIVIKLLLIPLGLAAVVLRSMWIEFPAPEGVELKYNDAPRLFDLAKKIQSATKGPPVHKVLLTGEYNAGIVQRPRLGMFGWQENYLLVGMPLLQALSPTEVRAVLAHEFGHLSGNHGKFSGWIYRVRQTWIQVLTNLQQHGKYGSGLFERFFNWYAPYFSAYSFVLARIQEYEADRCSVKVTGKQASARALINLELKGRVLDEEFLPGLFKKADHEPRPPDNAFTEMLNVLRVPVPTDKAQLWFTQMLNRRHAYSDTHPALADRLVSLGYADVRERADLNGFAIDEAAESGLEHFLKKIPKGLVESRNREWQERVNSGWVDRYQFVREAERSLIKLNEKAKTEALTLEETWDRARFVVGTQDYEAGIPYLEDVLKLMPDHAAANYMLGEALLGKGGEEGIKHIEVALEKDHSAIPAGCELIYLFLTSRDRKTEAEKYRKCVSDYYAELELANAERVNISKKDSFSAHGLAAEAVAALRSQLASYSQLGTAILVKKVVKHFPDEPSFVLGITSKRAWYSSQNNARDQELINHLAANVSFPGYTYIIALEKDYKPLRKIFARINGSQIYQG